MLMGRNKIATSMDQPGQFFMILLKLMNTKNTLKVSVYRAYSLFCTTLARL
jgi:hypothetical protein